MTNSLRGCYNPGFLLISVCLFSFRTFGFDAPSVDPALKFIENKNQWARDVHFSAKIPGGNMVIGGGKFAYYFVDGKHIEDLHESAHHPGDPDATPDLNIKKHALLVNFIGSNAAASPMPFGRSTEYYNYYLNNDPAKWASRAYAYDGMIYPSFYENIDLKIYSSGQHLKYDFIVAPYGDASQIKLEYDGADNLRIDNNGNLVVKTSLADIIEKRPFVYQFINGKKVSVESEYVLKENQLSFRFPKGYDPCYEMVIDPLLIFSTYSGSTADNWGSTATPGEHGTLYSSGVTNQTTYGGSFPATTGAFQTAYGGLYDIGILKYDSTGSTLLYATFIGGEESESPHSLVVNANEELIVLGTTSSYNFPTTPGAFDESFNEGSGVSHVVDYSNGSDIFVARIAKDGTQLLGSTFFGGSFNDGLNNANGGLVKNYGDQLRGDVITDHDGNIFISSVTSSEDLPLTNGFDLDYNEGATDAILVKFSLDLTQMLWGTYLGGSGADASHTLKLDAEGNIFIAGGTNSIDFALPAGGYQPQKKGAEDGWIAKIAFDGSAILSGTFTGTSQFDQVYFLDLNADEEVYVYGQTAGSFEIFPDKESVYNNPGSGQFLQKFSNTLSTLIFSTVFGSGSGVPDISPTAFLVNECNNIYMTGWGGEVNRRTGFWPLNGTLDMPVTPDAFQATSSGSDFYFIVLTDNATRFLYGTYMGGNQSRTHVDGGTSRFDKGGIVYHAVCSGCMAFNASNLPTSDFPTTEGVWSQRNNSGNCNNAAFKFDLSSLKARLQTNSVERNMPGLKFVCQPDKIVFENLSTGGEIFQWDLGDGTKVIKVDTSFIIHEYKQTGQYLVKLKAIDQGTCKAVDSTFTIVNVFKIQAVVQDDDDLCEGTSYKLSASGGAFYEWKTSDNWMSNAPEPTVSPSDTTIYFVTIADPNGCVLTDTVRLNVIWNINPEFTFSRVFDCFNRPSIRIDNQTDSLNAEDVLFLDYGDGNTTDLFSDEHYYENDGDYQLRLVGSRHGCIFEKTADIPLYTVKIPNVITPGSTDGLNDKLIVRYGDTDGVTPGHYGFKVSIVIYNRWGGILYKNDDYQYDWSGEGLATGIYYYEITMEGHGTCKTWLHLLK